MSRTLVENSMDVAPPVARHPTLTHLIHPCEPSSPQHARAQEVTFAALRNATLEAYRRRIEVELLAAVREGEERVLEPPARLLPPLRWTPAEPLSGGASRCGPLFADLMHLAYEHGCGDYVIWTSMDLTPQVDFYYVIQRLLPPDPRRLRALVIQRRTISDRYSGPEQLRAMYDERGVPEEGCGCFVFPRAWIPQLVLGDLPVGAAGCDGTLLANLEVLSGYRTDVLCRQRLAFHLGGHQAPALAAEVCQFAERETTRLLELLQLRGLGLPGRSRWKREVRELVYAWKIRSIRRGW